MSRELHQMMQAVVLERFGPPEELRLRDVPRPGVGPNDILVEVIAAAVNPVDTQTARGQGSSSWAGIEPPAILGSDASGVVCEVGPAVKGLRVGDEVFYFSDFLGATAGSYAEYQAVDSRIVAHKPRELTHVEAAAVPLAGGTAYEVVIKRLAVQRGESLLIFGAAGGVGSYAVQLGALAGSRVIAVSRKEHHTFLHDLGAEETLDYTEGDVIKAVADRVGEVDVAVDLVGGETVQRGLQVIRAGGRVATICDLSGNFELAIDKNITIHGVLVRPNRARLQSLAQLASGGSLRVCIRREFPLAEVVAAHRLVEDRHGRGKVVLRVRPEPTH